MKCVRDRPVPPWRDGAELGAPSLADFAVDLVRRVIPIPSAISAELAARGLVGIDASPESVRLLGDAVSWIALVPELASILQTLVRNIHFLAAEPGYDISHSEPRWRSSIFVSIPDRDDDIGALRLAESVVHEAMHLQLTNREEIQPFVARRNGLIRSPWRDEDRPYQGVLHGLYVFSCLACFFGSLLDGRGLSEVARGHVAQRVCEIAEEIRSIDFAALVGGLSNAGVALIKQCRAVSTERPALVA